MIRFHVAARIQRGSINSRIKPRTPSVTTVPIDSRIMRARGQPVNLSKLTGRDAQALGSALTRADRRDSLRATVLA